MVGALELSTEKCFWYMYMSVNKAYSISRKKNLNMLLTALALYKNYFDADIKVISASASEYTRMNILKDNYKYKFSDSDIYLLQVVFEYIELNDCYEEMNYLTSEKNLSRIIEIMGEEKFIKEVLIC